MHITYTTQTGGFEPGKVYANPRGFMRCRRGATSVTIMGDWPVVAAAYAAAGVPVEVVTPRDMMDPPKRERPEARAAYTDEQIDAMSWQELRSAASDVSDDPVINKAQAIAVLKGEA